MMNQLTEFRQQLYQQLEQFEEKNLKIASTSSFQTQSLPLLHLLSQFSSKIPILFLDTGFHFPETYQYIDLLEEKLGIDIQRIASETPKSQQIDHGKFLYDTQPDYCCHLNKVIPLDKELEKFEVWISGVRRDQTQFRQNLETFQHLKNGQIKYHPMLDWTSKDIFEYNKMYDLPEHPLTEKGFLSIGCMPCSRSALDNMQREGRWFGRNKSECGIHLNKN